MREFQSTAGSAFARPDSAIDAEAGDAESAHLTRLLTDELGPRSLEELMDALLTTAIEGGANYWCQRVTLTAGAVTPDPTAFGEIGMPWYVVAFQAGAEMMVEPDDYSGESEPVWLDHAAGIRGLSLLVDGKYCAKRYATDLIENKDAADADTADVWLQLAVFGEVIYG